MMLFVIDELWDLMFANVLIKEQKKHTGVNIFLLKYGTGTVPVPVTKRTAMYRAVKV